MLSSKELMHLEDFLGMEQTSVKAFNHFANMTQDSQSKQMLQQMAQKCQQNFQTVSRHLNAGQNLQ
ncbi:MAG: ferritin-like domain-containing protein [Negativicutes bacterium]|nr:ferritin-like domain-containing protein [Negativicutes bacterium]